MGGVIMTNYLSWSVEQSVVRGGIVYVCPCGGDVVTVAAPDEWHDTETDHAIAVFAEVVAGVCMTCGAVVSMSVNIEHTPEVAPKGGKE